MSKKQLLYDIAIIAIITLFLEVFSLSSLGQESFIKNSAVLSIGIVMMIFFIIGFFFKRGLRLQSLDRVVLFFIVSMFISSFMAAIYWDQPFLSSLMGYKPFYIYFLYFLLIFTNISAKRIQRIIIFLFFVSLLIFLVDYFTFPNPLFSWRNEERRNGISIFFYGQGFTFLGAFYFLNRFFTEKKWYGLLLFVISFVFLFLLTQSRMNLLALALGFFLLLITSNFKKKFLITGAIIIGAVIFYNTSSIFTGIKEASSDQAQFYKEDIRVLAHDYFLFDLQGGKPTMIFGNGLPYLNSKLGLAYIQGNAMGFSTSDVGLTGIYSYFGVFGFICWVVFFYKAFTIKVSAQSMYLKAYFVTLLTTAFVAYSIFEPGYMPATILVLYLFRCETLAKPDDDELEVSDI